MTSTDIKIGLTSSTRPSSRVLKPPGGGHTNIFGEPDVAVNAPRPKYNQQNSSNLNACMGSTDPNLKVEKLREEITQPKTSTNDDNNKSETKSSNGTTNNSAGGNNNNNNNNNGARPTGRVPPGGYSSGGFW